jgi:solute carrier family 25 protein 39/40
MTSRKRDTLSTYSLAAKALAGISGSIITNVLLTPLDVLKIRQQNVMNGNNHGVTTMSTRTRTTTTHSKPFVPTNWLSPCSGCGHFARNNGGLLDRFFCATSRFTLATKTAATTATTTTAEVAAATTSNHACSSTLSSKKIPSLCGLCGNHHQHSHSIWERCTPPQKKYTTLRASGGNLSNSLAASDSLYSTFRSVVKTEGIPALWDGLRPALLLSSINVVLYMIAYDELSKDILPNRFGWNTSLSTIVAGGASRAIAGIVVSPLELIRTQMQSSKSLASRGVVGGIQSIVGRDGIMSLWRGYSATMWRDVPFSIIYWYGFEALKRTIQEPLNNVPIRDNLFLSSFAAGAGSGMFAAFLTTPFDVIKTRRQVTQGVETRTARLLLDIVQSEGLPALFSGVVPRVIKVAPACGILIGTYHYVQEAVAVAGQSRQM